VYWLNGVNVGGGSSTHAITTTGDLTIGYMQGDGTKYIQGSIRDFCIYNTDIGGSNVQAMYEGLNPNEINSSNLVGYWKLNEGAHAVAYDSANWSSADGLTFTGKVRTAYINIPHSTSLDIVSELTVSGWAKLNSLITGDRGVLQKGDNFRLETGWGNYAQWITSTGASLDTYTELNLADDTWHFWTATYSASGAVKKLYIDGTENHSTAVTGNLTSTTDPVLIGLRQGNDGYMAGALKELTIWNRALTSSEISELYSSGNQFDATSHTRSANLKGYWKLDDIPSDNVIKDLSGNGNNGNIVGSGDGLIKASWDNNGTITGASWTVANLGNDKNGNNNWDLNNLDISDQVLDTPTDNFCTLNPLQTKFGTGNTYSEGNLKITGDGGTGFDSTTGTTAVSSGKWYYEWNLIGLGSSRNTTVGFADLGVVDGVTYDGTSYNNAGFYQVNFDSGSNIYYYINGVVSYESLGASNGDIISFAVDIDAGTLDIYYNGSLQESKTGIAFAGPITPFAETQGTGAPSIILNFGQDSSFAGNKTAQSNTDDNGYGDFYYSPPTGYLALCTSNLPDPAVIPSEHFNTVTYTGDGNSGRDIDVGLQPDMVWIKSRNHTYSNEIFDSVRGVTKRLITNATDAESTKSGVTAFNTDGFELGSNASENADTKTYVAWNWKANGTGVSNTDGDITSTVSANVDAGFSIVSWTASGTGSDTIGHGLSSKVEFFAAKRRDGTRNWHNWHKDLPNDGYLNWNTSTGEATSNGNRATVTNNTTITAEGVSGQDYIAYCFHSVDGYSKVGSYTGNGSTDGTFVYTGFRPAYVMIKRTDATSNWNVYDNRRDEYNAIDGIIRPNTPGTESTGTDIFDFTSNGFKARYAFASGSNYIYLAFAEHPFKYTNAR